MPCARVHPPRCHRQTGLGVETVHVRMMQGGTDIVAGPLRQSPVELRLRHAVTAPHARYTAIPVRLQPNPQHEA